MRIRFNSRNIPLTDAFKDLANKKLKKLERYFTQETELTLLASQQGNHYVVEVTIPFNGSMIRGEESTGDLFSAVENVVEKLERQLQRHRSKLQHKWKHIDFSYEAEQEPTIDENEMEIVRTKSFSLKPIDAEEAVLQMELLDHAFFVFINGSTQQVNVVYKRKDGRYGLIEPDLG